MSGTLPPDARVRLIVCEDVRQELFNKLTIIGFFPGEQMQTGNIGPEFAIPLTFLFLLEDGIGKYKGAFEIKTPSGTSVMKHDAEIEKIKDQPAMLMIKLMNFPLIETGDFPVTLSLDGKTYERYFRIVHNPALKPLE